MNPVDKAPAPVPIAPGIILARLPIKGQDTMLHVVADIINEVIRFGFRIATTSVVVPAKLPAQTSGQVSLVIALGVDIARPLGRLDDHRISILPGNGTICTTGINIHTFEHYFPLPFH